MLSSLFVHRKYIHTHTLIMLRMRKAGGKVGGGRIDKHIRLIMAYCILGSIVAVVVVVRIDWLKSQFINSFLNPYLSKFHRKNYVFYRRLSNTWNIRSPINDNKCSHDLMLVCYQLFRFHRSLWKLMDHFNTKKAVSCCWSNHPNHQPNKLLKWTINSFNHPSLLGRSHSTVCPPMCSIVFLWQNNEQNTEKLSKIYFMPK